MKIAAAAIWHETLSFAHTRTELSDFHAFQYTEGADVAARNRSVANEMGGFLSAGRDTGATIVPLLFAGALPSPTVSAASYGHIKQRLVALLREALPVDGMLLALHGAMVAEGVDDAEADLLAAIREVLGASLPVVVTLDLHANASEALFHNASAIVAYDTYPHVDMFERGVEAVHILRALHDGQPVAGAFRKLPLLTAPQGQATASEPLCSLMRRVHEFEADPRVLAIAVVPGYPYADVERLGFSLAVYTRGDQALAESIASELARMVWSQRAGFAVVNTTPREAVERARASERTPVILVDAADNIGGGTPGDGTVLLRELVEQGAEDAVVTIADAESVRACFEAGAGSTVNLRIGGKYDANHGAPLEVTAYVRLLSDGVYRHTGSYMTGLRVEMGRTAVVRVNGVQVVLMERKALPFDAEQIRSVGIDPARQRIIVVKSALAWRAAYGDLAGEVITVDTPGLCTSNLATIPYRKRPRPMFPLEDPFYE